MTAILTLTVLVLIGISIWQFQKCLNYRKPKETPLRSQRQRQRYTRKIDVCFLAFIYIITFVFILLGGCIVTRSSIRTRK